MRVLLDTNVVLDAILRREPFSEEAEKVLRLLATGAADGFIAAQALTDIYYIIRKALTEQQTREAIRNLSAVLSVVDLYGDDCLAALDSVMPDYEDAVMMLSCVRANLDCAVTRDNVLLQSETQIPVITPSELLKRFQ